MVQLPCFAPHGKEVTGEPQGWKERIHDGDQRWAMRSGGRGPTRLTGRSGRVASMMAEARSHWRRWKKKRVRDGREKEEGGARQGRMPGGLSIDLDIPCEF